MKRRFHRSPKKVLASKPLLIEFCCPAVGSAVPAEVLKIDLNDPADVKQMDDLNWAYKLPHTT